ncbi:MAG: FAD-dependent oxidoreductase [Frankia sp.]
MTRPVLIAGAGIAGTALAYFLQNTGCPAVLLERRAGPAGTSAGIVVHPNALSALGALGRAVREHGNPITTQVTRFPDNSQTVVDWGRVWGNGSYPLGIDRAVLADILRDAARNVPTHWGVEVVDAYPDRDGGVVCVLADGEKLRGSVLVGADGIHSRVRATVDDEARPRYTGQFFRRTIVDAAAEIPSDAPPGTRAGTPADTQWQVWRCPGGSVGRTPIGGGKAHVFAEIDTTDLGPVVKGSELGLMRQAIRQAGAELPLPEVCRVDSRPAYTLISRRLTRGRIALVGDAAHAVHPSTSQGAALGLEDAAVLAEEIHRSGPSEKALRAYELRRAPRLESFLRAARIHQSLLAGMGVATGPHDRGTAIRQADGWYRRLYRDLLDPA